VSQGGSGLPGKGAAAGTTSSGLPGTPTSGCAAAAGVSKEEQAALDAVGPLQGRPQADIEADLKKQGYSGVTAKSGGKVYTKDLGDGRTAAVRLDPYNPRSPAGYADAVPHAHKETLPSTAVSGGNYSNQAAGLTKFDDTGKPSTDMKAVHIPTG